MVKTSFIKVRVSEADRQRYRRLFALEDRDLSSTIRASLERVAKRIEKEHEPKEAAE